MPFRTNEQVRELIDAIPDPMIIINAEGKIVLGNKQMEAVFGYSSAELTGHEVEMLMPSVYRNWHQHLRKGYYEYPEMRSMGKHSELWAQHKMGYNFPVEVSLSPLHTKERLFVLVTVRDVSGRKKAEKELEDSYVAIRQLTEYLQNIREDERSDVAREIHDELGQQLTVMLIHLKWLDKQVGNHNEKVRERIDDLLSLVDKTIQSVRRISTDLRPPVLDDFGIVAAAQQYMASFENRTGVKCEITAPETEPALSQAVKNALFRILQESLTNVARHAEAGKVEVSVETGDDIIILTIHDNGKGFDNETVSARKTLGLLGMQERARMVGGEYIIRSAPGQGSTVTVKVPINNKK